MSIALSQPRWEPTARPTEPGPLPAREIRGVLDALFEECRTENWDGHGARPFDADALRSAHLFLERLPDDIAPPDVSPEPDGQIALDWYRNPKWLLSVSVGPGGMLYYAGLFGGETVKGAVPFGADVPPIVLGLIRRAGV